MCFLDPEPSKSPATAEIGGKNWSRSPSKPLHHRPKANSCQVTENFIFVNNTAIKSPNMILTISYCRKAEIMPQRHDFLYIFTLL